MILLLTHSGDFYTIDGVEAGLQALGAPYTRVDTDKFPARFTLSASTEGPAVLECEGFELDLASVTGAWCRRLWPGAQAAGLDPATAMLSAETSRVALLDTLQNLEKVRWVNDIAAGQRAESKLWQLKLAREVGLRVPPTLVSNRPDAVRDFMTAHGNRLITKLLVPPVQAMEAHPAFAYTTRVGPEHLKGLDQLRLMPQIFQPEVPKRAELRVIVVDGEFFVGRFEAADATLIDWRCASDVTWTVGALPPATQLKVLALMSRLGLVFGALDFLEDEGEEPWFLEVNQAGEWGWLERDLGLPIAAAIARALTRPR